MFSTNNNKENQENSHQSVINYEGNDSNKLLDNDVNEDLSKENNENDDENVYSFDGGLENLPEQKVDESKLPKSYEEIMGKKLAKETKKIAYDFIKVFYNFDGDETRKYIEKSKKHMTNDLFMRLMEEPEIPTHYEFKRKFLSADISESNDYREEDVEEAIPYIAHVKGKITDVLGEKVKEQTDVYVIILVKEGDEYKVGEVLKNVPFY